VLPVASASLQDASAPACSGDQAVFSASGRLRVDRSQRMGGVPREQKMLKGHLPRVIYHQAYLYTKSRKTPLADTHDACEGCSHRNVQRFRGGLVFKAHRLLYHSTLALRVIKKKKFAPSSLYYNEKCVAQLQILLAPPKTQGVLVQGYLAHKKRPPPT